MFAILIQDGCVTETPEYTEYTQVICDIKQHQMETKHHEGSVLGSWHILGNASFQAAVYLYVVYLHGYFASTKVFERSCLQQAQISTICMQNRTKLILLAKTAISLSKLLMILGYVEDPGIFSDI